MEFAQLGWEDGSPFNLRFGDIYYSRRGALEEVEQVFLGGNGLSERWRDCRCFAIGETGFGTGLNFFVTAAHWLKTAPAEATLHYFSIEKFPLAPEDVRRAMAPWPALHSYAEEFVGAFEGLCDGFQRRYLFGDRVLLTLAIGDAAQVFVDSAGTVDAWYLDGFAPKRNPQMWSDEVIDGVARMSRSGSTFSTFTAAGEVRRRLIGAGFKVEKVPGFGGKRERMQGRYTGARVSGGSLDKPWFAHPAPATRRELAVVGGGVAGLAAAVAMVRRGWQVTLYDGNPELGTGASGVPAALVAPKLRGSSRADAFVGRSYRFVIPWLNQLQARVGDLGWRQGGVVDFSAADGSDELVGGVATPLVAGRSDASQGCFIPSAGWVLTRRFFEGFVAGFPSLELRLGCRVGECSRRGDDWLVADAEGTPLGSHANVLLAQGWATAPLLPELGSELRKVRGQATVLAAHDQWRCLEHATRCRVHVIPLAKGRAVVGSTYERDVECCEVVERDHQTNLRALAEQPLGWSASSAHIEGGWAGIRLVAPDYAPIVGPVADADFFSAAYSDLHHGKAAASYPPACYLGGLYTLTGLGSRGFVTGPLAAELIADYLTGVPVCVERDSREALHPARFLIKNLKRRSKPNSVAEQ